MRQWVLSIVQDVWNLGVTRVVNGHTIERFGNQLFVTGPKEIEDFGNVEAAVAYLTGSPRKS